MAHKKMTIKNFTKNFVEKRKMFLIKSLDFVKNELDCF